MRHIGLWSLAVLAALGLATACGLHRHRATRIECEEIFARLVTLEMEEQGFHDPVAVDRARQRLSRELAPSIATCEGKRLATKALPCVRQARRAEQITHVCLE